MGRALAGQPFSEESALHPSRPPRPYPNPVLTVTVCLMLCLTGTRASAQTLSVKQTASSYEFTATSSYDAHSYKWTLENSAGQYWAVGYDCSSRSCDFTRPISALPPATYWLRVEALWQVDGQLMSRTQRTNQVKLPLPRYDVGVIPAAGSCPDDANTRVQYFMDNESYKEESFTRGWTGGITMADSNGNTSFLFCRVDGLRFRNLAASSDDRSNYAVLKLGQDCPPGSKEFTRGFDNEDSNNINHLVAGAFLPNAYGGAGTGGWTKLRFCFFNSDPSAPRMDGFPSLGFDYGVFATSSHRLALSSGQVFTDDEDGGHNTWDPPDAVWKPEATRIISEGLNTNLHTIRVRVFQSWMSPVLNHLVLH